MRPRPYRWDGRELRTVFVDWTTGRAVRDDGAPPSWAYAPKGGRMRVSALLAMAEAEGCRRVLLTGKRPGSSAWLDDPPGEGWTAGGHYVDLDDPCGRWVNDTTGRVTEIRRAAAWLGEGSYSPGAAREALAVVHRLLAKETGGRVGVMSSPAASGQSLWAAGLPEGWPDGQLCDELAGLVRSVSPQHREEVLGRCFDGCGAHRAPPRGKLAGLVYLDGRFMFAACCRELGVGDGAFRLTQAQAAAWWEGAPVSSRGRVLAPRGLYQVRVTIPEDWTGPGLLPFKHEDGRHWHYPNRPGWAGETWVDGAELAEAQHYGWSVIFLGGLAYGPGARPLDRFSQRVVRLRSAALTAHPGEVGELAAAGLRSMFLRTVGAFHSRGRLRSHTVPAGVELPGHVTTWTERGDGSRVYVERTEPVGNAAAFARPELTAQVWARARRKVLAQAMTVEAAELVGVWGDALYLTRDPGWPDTGGVGAFRVKGRLAGPVARPTNLSGLLRLRARMEG